MHNRTVLLWLALSTGCTGETDETRWSMCDDLDKVTFYVDNDGDGYGDADQTKKDCIIPHGWVANQDDCNDDNPLIHPKAEEICDEFGQDEDCDGLVNDADPNLSPEGLTPLWVDADLDGYGSNSVPPMWFCEAPDNTTTNRVSNHLDCDDSHSEISPSEQEVCTPENVDEDCDGFADDLDPEGAEGQQKVYSDKDLDTYGDETDEGQFRCHTTDDTVFRGGDCDDTRDWIHPNAEESLDFRDSNCDRIHDEVFVTHPGITALEGEGKLGTEVVGLGDINGDGLDDFAVSDAWFGEVAKNGGRVYVFLGRTVPLTSQSIDNADLIWDDSEH